MTKSPPGAWRPLALLLTLNLLCYLDRYILAAVEPQIRATFFAPDDPNALQKTGWLASAFLISYMVTAPLFGWLADRFSRWLIIAFGVAVWSLASWGTGLAPTFAILLVTRIFVGVGEAAYGPAAPTILSDLYPVERRGIILAWFFAAIPVGSALGYMFGGAVGSAMGWRWPFHLVALPGVALAVVCLFFRDRRPKSSERRPHAGLSDYLGLLKIRSYTLNVAAQTAMTFAIGGMSFWAPAYFYNYRRLPDLGQINLLFGGITAVAGLLATLFGGWAGDWLARKNVAGAYFWVSASGMLLAFPSTLGMLYAPFPWAWGLCFLAIFFLFFNIGPANTAISNVTAPQVRASAFAINIFVIHALGDAISPPLIGAIADRWNLNAGFFVVSLMMLAAGIFWLIGTRYLPADEKRLGEPTSLPEALQT